MKLLYGVLLFTLGQILVWFQSNGQFLWPIFKKNTFFVAMIGGTIVSYMLIHATRLIAEHYGGLIWPGRFIGFSLGMFVFSYLTWQFMDEGINTKTLISIVLAFLLICVQIFWK
jgi:hypothetical protein